MATSAAIHPWGWAAILLRERDLTVAGLVLGAVKVSVQQLAGQAAGDASATVAGAVPLDAVGPLAWLVGGLAALAAVVNGWTFGLAGAAALLVLPVGGPVWAGVVPLGTTLTGTRRGLRWAGTVLAAATVAAGTRVPAVRNVSRTSAADNGHVTLTVLIVDDSAPFREAARQILCRDGLDVVGTAASAAEALAGVAALRPQVALVDVNLGADSGFDVARLLADDAAERPVCTVLMSTRSEDELAELIAGSPAAGFVAKERLSGVAVRSVLAGRA